MYGALGWQNELRIVGMDAVAQFRGAPGRELFFEVHNQLVRTGYMLYIVLGINLALHLRPESVQLNIKTTFYIVAS